MRKRNLGFTISEILVVVAIVTTLAALIFPVFMSVRASALQASCAANFHQAYMAAHLYLDDYDDHMMLTNHQADNPNSRNDRTWVQLVLPYTKNFSLFRCPADTTERPRPEATFDQDLIPGDTTSAYYQASLRSNIGYNYLYLAPVVKEGDTWRPQPRVWSEVATPEHSLLFADTAYQVLNGAPSGGGSYLVIPPCRYSIVNSQAIDTFFSAAITGPPRQVKTNIQGWDPNSPFPYGNAWAWHTNRVTIVRLDGSATSKTMDQLSEGCDVEKNWSGFIYDSSHYIWPIHD